MYRYLAQALRSLVLRPWLSNSFMSLRLGDPPQEGPAKGLRCFSCSGAKRFCLMKNLSVLAVLTAPLVALAVFAALFWKLNFTFNQSWLLSSIYFPASLALYFGLKITQSASIGRGMADVAELPAVLIVFITSITAWYSILLIKITYTYFTY